MSRELIDIDTVDFIRQTAAAMTFTQEVTTLVDNADGTYDLEMCNTWHQVPLCDVTYDGKIYRVIDVEHNVKVVIQDINAVGAPSQVDFVVAAPKFLHGTLLDVNNETFYQEQTEDIFPLIYLFEKYTEDYEHRVTTLVKTSRLRMFQFAETPQEPTDWKIDDHYEKVILAMKSLTREMVRFFQKSKFIGIFDAHTEENWKDFGIIKGNSGEKELLFNAYCSGVELRIDIPFKRNNDCSNFCKCLT